jgi:hypothetical protein
MGKSETFFKYVHYEVEKKCMSESKKCPLNTCNKAFTFMIGICFCFFVFFLITDENGLYCIYIFGLDVMQNYIYL